jgi:hypothetical protein
VGRERLEVVLPPGVLVLDTARIEGEPLRAIEARVDVTEERTDIAVTSGLAFLARENEPELRIGEGRFATIAADGGVASEGVERAGDHPDRARGRRDAPHPRAGSLSLRHRGVHLRSGGGALTDPMAGARSSRAGGVRRPSICPLATTPGRWWGGATRSWRGAGRAARSWSSWTWEPPALALSSPSEGATIASEVVTIRGSTEADARIEVDGVSVTVEPDGTFRTTRALPRGLTNLVIRARDSVGNSRVVSRSVVRR